MNELLTYMDEWLDNCVAMVTVLCLVFYVVVGYVVVDVSPRPGTSAAVYPV